MLRGRFFSVPPESVKKPTWRLVRYLDGWVCPAERDHPTCPAGRGSTDPAGGDHPITRFVPRQFHSSCSWQYKFNAISWSGIEHFLNVLVRGLICWR